MKELFYRSIIILLIPLFIPSIPVFSQEADFDTVYNLEYQIDNSLVVSVKESIGVINQSDSAIPSSFIETITNISVYDIEVLDENAREIRPEIEEKGKNITIKIPITDPAIGKAKKTSVTLMYKTRDLAQKTGRILNLSIPKAPVSNFIQEYNVSVKIPKDFGPQISVTPQPYEEKMEEEGYTLLYNKQTLEHYGISATFGDYQIFDFDLNYELSNPSFFARTMEFPIPMPIKDYQEISVTNLTPAPTKLRKDGDGNVLAEYKVPGKKAVSVRLTGKAKVYNKKIRTDYTDFPVNSPNMSAYLKEQRFWETKNPVVVNTATGITNTQNSAISNALGIYTYLTKNIKYDYEAASSGIPPERKGAVRTLNEKIGLCADYSDTFIALARASGLPARALDGYAYAKDVINNPVPLGGDNSEFMHSWVQFYDPGQGWVAIDPTWGATSGLDYFRKLDNNHLVFVIKGFSSQKYAPAQQVKVNFSNDEFFSHESIYDLENLPQTARFSTTLIVVLAFVLALGLCVILILLKVRPNPRYK